MIKERKYQNSFRLSMGSQHPTNRMSLATEILRTEQMRKFKIRENFISEYCEISYLSKAGIKTSSRLTDF